METGEGRLQWLDALRGFTMVLVVAYHVAQVGFGESERTTAALPLLVLVRMPTFFFVSGFLAYKASFQWTVPNALRLTWKKVKVQVIPTIVFLCVFLVVRKAHFWDSFVVSMRSPTKGGYWFTWVLLQMFVIYYMVCLMAKRRNWPIWLLWLASILVYESLYMPKYFTYHKDLFFFFTSLIQTMKFMQFFLFGNLVHRYWPKAQKVIDSPWFFPLVVIMAFLCVADFLRWHCLKFMWTNLPRTLAMYLLLTIVVIFFRHYESWFSQGTPLGRSLQYIGTRTLDIYLLHYIFLPSLPSVGAWLNRNSPNFVVDIVLSLSVGLVVIGFCLLTSSLLRISPFLRLYLFGKK